jgi:hypothetical protein
MRSLRFNAGTLIACLVMAACGGSSGTAGQPTPTSTPTPTPTGAPTASVLITPTPGLVILEPEIGATVSEGEVLIRGTGPAHAVIVRDIRLASDENAIADSAGNWAMLVSLKEGPNQLRFRVGDDKSTAIDWILVYVPAVAVATLTPVPATPSPPPTPAPSPSATATATPVPTATEEPEPEGFEFDDDLYSVPDEIPPGTYRTLWPADGCYWARLKGFSGDLDDIIANSFGNGYQVVTIKAADRAFESSGCDLWTDDLSQVTDDDRHFGEGTFIVGTDIRPGTYRSSQGDGCYWARLKGFSGTLSEIIANDYRSSGRATVTIRAKDKGFTSSRCGDWSPN